MKKLTMLVAILMAFWLASPLPLLARAAPQDKPVDVAGKWALTVETAAGLRSDLEDIARETFKAAKKGWIKVQINQRYKLADAMTAHRDLEARKTTGCTILTL